MSDSRRLERGFTLTRIVDAPRELVFRAWTDPDHLQWFFSETTPPGEPIEVDLRVGGTWKLKMIESEEKQYFTGGIYTEIVPVEKIAFIWGATDGWPEIDNDRIEDSPVITVTLNELGDKTEMNFHLQLPDHLPEARIRDWFAIGIREGSSQTIDRLVAKFASPAKVAGST
jgi:uncharacterized protein YndB with AHSA1/START domain